MSDPRDLPTLVHLLRRRAETHGRREAYRFLDNGESIGARWSYAELDRRARAVAAHLQVAAGPKAGPEAVVGRRFLLLFPPGLDFAAGFLGCLYAGAVAVPAYPPASRRHLPRLRAIWADADPAGVLTTSAIRKKLERAARQIDGLGDRPWIDVDPLTDGDAWAERLPAGDSLAFLQYTSGSTGAPKGVEVGHEHLMHNERLIAAGFATSAEDVVVGWLPLYHDMGLIGNLLHPLWHGGRCVLMAPVAFLQKPLRWLRAVTDAEAPVVSGGPDFAYALCAERIGREEARSAGLDLTTWRVAFSGAEPVRAETLDRFTAAFADYGFARRAFYPCYGMAEATLMISGGDPAREPIVRELSASALESDLAVPPEDDSDEPRRRLVACGRSLLGQDLRVVDPTTRRPLPADRVGEIWLAGPSVASGYRGRPDATEHDFRARIAVDSADSPRDAPAASPFLRTGDLGFVDAEGRLFVTGRLKDLVIVRGRNHYPQDLEQTVEAAHPALRPGASAAFAVELDQGPRGSGEALVVVAEVERHVRDAGALEHVIEAARAELAEIHAVAARDIVLIRQGSIPKTSSGKIRRRATREALAADELPVLASLRRGLDAASETDPRDHAVEPEPLHPEAALDRQTLDRLEPAARRPALVADLRRGLARRLGVPAHTLALRSERPLTTLGVDSLTAVWLQADLKDRFDVHVDLTEILGGAPLADLIARLLGDGEDASSLLDTLDAARTEHHDETGDERPLTAGERSLFYLHRLDPSSAAYHIVGAARVRGPLDLDALDGALGDLLRRHDTLRTSYHESAEGSDGEQPVARIASIDSLPESFLRVVEVADENALERAIQEEAHRPFEVEHAPLLRAVALRAAAASSEITLSLTVHHLVADGASLEIVERELWALYGRHRMLRAGVETAAAISTPPPLATYADLARWQALPTVAAARAERVAERVAAWRAKGETPTLDLPTDRPRPAVQSFRGNRVVRRVDAALARDLEALGRRLGATSFTVLLAGFVAWLHRATGQDDLAVGTPATVRSDVALEGTVGYFVQPAALRFDIRGRPSFVDLVERVSAEVLEALRHREAPFDEMVAALSPTHDPSRSPLFQAFFVHQRDRRPEDRSAGFIAGDLAPPKVLPDPLGDPGADLTIAPRTVEIASSPFDLTCEITELSDSEGHRLGWAVGFRYAAELFERASMECLLERFERLLRAAVAAPDQPVARLPWLDEAERRDLLVGRQPPAPRSEPGTLIALLTAQAARTPERIALVDGEREIAYRDLHGAARRLARDLRAVGVGPDVLVAVRAERSAELVAGLLGTLLAGGAYVPIDPAYPAERLAFTLEDARPGVLLVDAAFSPRTLTEALSTDPPLVIDLSAYAPGTQDTAAGGGMPDPLVDPANLAYVIYTSGSTGRPKGVALSHASAAAFVEWSTSVFSDEHLTGVLAATSICFDLSVFELFVPLCRGGTVILARDALALDTLPARERVTLVNTVPSAAGELAGRLPTSTRVVNLAGEPLPGNLVARLYEQVHVEAVYNLYGPSEDTTYSTFARIARQEPTPPIGRPLPGSRGYLIDQELEPVPAGRPGELLLAGAGLARGYLDRPALTAERFVPDPFATVPGERAYRTGDLVRWRDDGELAFLGRLDHQVKVRGFRIELGEIEIALRAEPGVASAVVLARGEAGDARLVAYLEADAEARLEAAGLRASLTQRLPAFLIPQVFVVLDAFPLTPSGKIDRRALPEPEILSGADLAAAEYEPPATEVEEMLAEIWREVLGVERVGVTDSFFDLGGHSLQATRVLTRMRETFGVDIPVRSLLERPTIIGLTEAIAEVLLAEDVEALER